MNNARASIDDLFQARQVPRDPTGALAVLAQLFEQAPPALLYVADREGEVIAAEAFSSGQKPERSARLAALAARRLACVQRFGPRQEAAGGCHFGLRIGGEAGGGILGGLLEEGSADPWEGDAIWRALTAGGQLALEAVRGEAAMRVSRTRIRHLQAEKETLTGAHTEAIAKAMVEEERRIREEQERRAMEEICAATEAANRAKTEFLANMSHEIRTPLNAILGFAEFLLRGESEIGKEERHDYLETIYQSGRHLLELINDILDLSKIEAGRMAFEREECSPAEIVAEVLSVLRMRAEEKGLELLGRWPDGIPSTIRTDPFRLKQLLVNLVGNAVKFTPSGSVTVVARLVEEEGREWMAFDVVDTGMGIAPEKLETIFDMFAQADASVTREFGGTGLGLAISRRIARALGGNLSVRSKPGRGSTFTAVIDAGLAGDGEKPSRRPGRTTSHVPVGTDEEILALPPAKILLVEDGATNRKLTRLVLGRAGARVAEAENGRVGVARALAEPFDLILMDMQMPVLDGYSATSELRRAGLDVPIIALTADAMADAARRCLDAGCSACLTKPVEIDRLLSVVAEHLAGRQSAGRDPSRAEPSPAAPNGPAAGRSADEAARYGHGPIVSSLPGDDPEFREIAEEFARRAEEVLDELKAAWTSRDFEALARGAHWLKGSGGTAGFDAFTEPACRLERSSKAGEAEEVRVLLEGIESLVRRIVVPNSVG